MLLTLTGVDANRSPVCIDSDNIDLLVKAAIDGTWIITKSQNKILVLEDIDTINEMRGANNGKG